MAGPHIELSNTVDDDVIIRFDRMSRDCAWITVDDQWSVALIRTDEGLVVDVWDNPAAHGDPDASLYSFEARYPDE